jgi:hypothetical protein
MQCVIFCKVTLYLYAGHTSTLAECKSLYAPRWKEALATGKGVGGDAKSEGSHSQKRGTDGQKPDTRLNRGGQASNGLRTPQNQPYPLTVNQALPAESVEVYPGRSFDMRQNRYLSGDRQRGIERSQQRS